MNLLNIFRKNKYYEQLLFKALIQITCYRANVGEKRTEAELGGWPHYIVNYLVGKEMRDYIWSEDDESTTYYLSKPKLFVEGATENLGASEALHNLALPLPQVVESVVHPGKNQLRPRIGASSLTLHMSPSSCCCCCCCWHRCHRRIRRR